MGSQYRAVTTRPGGGANLASLIAARARALPDIYAVKQAQKEAEEARIAEESRLNRALEAEADKFNKTLEIQQGQNELLKDKLAKDAEASRINAETMQDQLEAGKMQNLASNALGVGGLLVAGYGALKNKQLVDALNEKLNPTLDLNPQYRPENFTGFFSDSGDDILALEESARTDVPTSTGVESGTVASGQAGGTQATLSTEVNPSGPPEVPVSFEGDVFDPSSLEGPGSTNIDFDLTTLEGPGGSAGGTEGALDPSGFEGIGNAPVEGGEAALNLNPAIFGGVAGLTRFAAGQLNGERWQKSTAHGLGAGIGTAIGTAYGGPIGGVAGAFIGEKAGGKIEEGGNAVWDTGETMWDIATNIVEEPENVPGQIYDAAANAVGDVAQAAIDVPEKVFDAISHYGCVLFTVFYGQGSREATNAKRYCAKFLDVPHLLGYYTMGYRFAKFVRRHPRLEPLIKKYFMDELAACMKTRLFGRGQGTLKQRVFAFFFMKACLLTFNLVDRPHVPKGCLECVKAALENTKVRERYAHIMAQC
jgi:hypothetical protein